MENREKLVILVDVIYKHMNETQAEFDDKHEFDKLKEKYRQLEKHYAQIY